MMRAKGPMFPETTITELETFDVRFPTSRELDGSDAMNPDPDYSAAYVVLRTDAGDGLEGHGFAFTIGRGNEVQVAAIDALRAARRRAARSSEICADTRAFSRRLTGDSQLRWLGPEKGVMHMAVGAVVNAVWDLRAKREGKPLWQLLADMPPERARRARRLPLPRRRAHARGGARRCCSDARGRARGARATLLRARAIPPTRPRPAGSATPTTSCAGSPARPSPTASTQIKLKVGADLEDDVRRCAIAREAVGPGHRGSRVDANQRVGRARGDRAGWSALAPFDTDWIEEPTSPDDVLGHAAIARGGRADRGRHRRARRRTASIFKQLLQAGAIDVLPDRRRRRRRASTRTSRSCCWPPSSACRSARTPAASACASSSSTCRCSTTWRVCGDDCEDRVIEYVDHLHEHFVDPVVVERRPLPRARRAPGFSAAMRPSRSPSTATRTAPSGQPTSPDGGGDA